MCIATWLYTKLYGKLVGMDEYGNAYYESRSNSRALKRKNRWVYYSGYPEPSKISGKWFSWLHYQIDTNSVISLPKNNGAEQLHMPNLTGTEMAYYPAGHVLGESNRCKSTGDYQAWRP